MRAWLGLSLALCLGASPSVALSPSGRDILLLAGKLDPSTRAIVAAFTTPPDAKHLAAINNEVKCEKAAGVWNLKAHKFALAAQNSQAAQVDWITATQLATFINSPTFTADQGVAGDGATSYVNFGAALSGTLFSQNSGMLAAYFRANSSSNSRAVGTLTAATSAISPRTGTNNFSVNANSSTNDTFSNSDSRGMFSWSRTASTTGSMYIRGANVAAIVSTTTGIGGGNVTSGDVNGVFTVRQTSLVEWGAVMNDAQSLADYTCFQAYMTALGTQV